MMKNFLLSLAIIFALHGAVRAGGSASGAFSRAECVWPEEFVTATNSLIAFRADIKKSGNGAEARLLLAAWYSYRITLNGEFVGFGPARGPKGAFRPDEYVLPLKDGDNRLQVEVASYNCRNFYLMRQAPFFKAAVVAGNELLAISGRDFRAYRLPRVEKVPRYSFQRTFCEVYKIPGCETGPLKLTRMGEVRLLERLAPYPAYEYAGNLQPIRRSNVKIDETFQVIDNRLMSLPGTVDSFDGFTRSELELNTAELAQRLAYSNCREIGAEERGKDRQRLSAGSSLLYDLKLNDTGFPGMTVVCRKPGRLVLTFDEILFRDGVHGCERMSGSCNNIVVWDIEKAGEYRLATFEPYTMRYFEIGVLSGDMEIGDVHFRSYKNSTATAEFRSSDAALDRIFAAAKETFRQNAVDVFMDCPSRERAGWNCDAYFTAPASLLLTGTTDLERLFIENQAIAERFEYLPDGMLPMCYPSDHGDGVYIPNWAMWFVIQAEEYLARSGDRELIDALKPKIEALISFFWKYRNSYGLLEKLPGWVFIEWSMANNFKQDVNYPSNMIWAQMLDVAARLYGRKDLAEEAGRVRGAIIRQSWNGQFFRDHALRGKDGSLVVADDVTETCQYYAFFSGVATKESHPGLWKELVGKFGPKRDVKKVHSGVHPSAPFIGDYLRLILLQRENRGNQILEETKSYFLWMAEKTGTLWEFAEETKSCNHGFASYAAVLLSDCVLGVERIDYKAKKIFLHSADAKIDWVEGVYPTKDGVLRIRREGRNFSTVLPDGWEAVTPQECATNKNKKD